MPEDLLTDYQKEFLASAKQVAIQMGEMGKNGGAPTGVIGELSACQKLGLKWKPTDGYDAVDGSGTIRYQIKTRKNWTEANKKKKWWNCHKVDPDGRMGRLEGKGNYDFDIGIYVELDDDFEVWGIWECEKLVLKKLEKGNDLGLHVKKVTEGGLRRYSRP
jgi:hypothetical protein